MMLVDMAVQLKTVSHDKLPSVKIMVDNTVIHDGLLHGNETFLFNDDMDIGTHRLSIELNNKCDSDSQNGKDMAVIIDNVSFFGIKSDKVLYESTYKPNYSESYLKTLTESGDNIDYDLKGCNYMGWNGIWSLNFDVPVFTWIHNVENLGWIYPK